MLFPMLSWLRTLLQYMKIACFCFCAFGIGCSSGPRAASLPTPETALQASLDEAAADALLHPSDDFPEQWWILFHDEQLTAFIQTAFENYPTLQEAEASILLAASRADFVRANLLPNIYWEADVSRQKLSETGLAFPMQNGPESGVSPPLPPGGVSGIPVYFTQYETELNLSFDLDLWKKNRNQLKSAAGEVYAAAADAAFVRLQLGMAVAQVYFQLQIDYQRVEVAKALVQNRRDYVEMVQQRMRGNIANEIPLLQAKYQWAEAQKSVLLIEADIAVLENQLRSYLSGKFEENIENIAIAAHPLPAIPLPKDLPLRLISRRPDISAQLWLIYSAGRQIQVAKAGFYPDLNLTAIAGFQSLRWQQLFLGKSSNFNIDPAVTLPIFDGGRLCANLRRAEVNYDMAIYKYNELVLQAVREVLDGIALMRNAEQQVQNAAERLRYQELLDRVTEQRVAGHLNSGLDTLSSQSTILSARDEELVALGQLFQAALRLIKALGGGYQVCESGGAV
jgi:NodT family efflux transporter outer membrane factor (OMF) lipoprotein